MFVCACVRTCVHARVCVCICVCCVHAQTCVFVDTDVYCVDFLVCSFGKPPARGTKVFTLAESLGGVESFAGDGWDASVVTRIAHQCVNVNGEIIITSCVAVTFSAQGAWVGGRKSGLQSGRLRPPGEQGHQSFGKIIKTRNRPQNRIYPVLRILQSFHSEISSANALPIKGWIHRGSGVWMTTCNRHTDTVWRSPPPRCVPPESLVPALRLDPQKVWANACGCTSMPLEICFGELSLHGECFGALLSFLFPPLVKRR